MYLCQYFKQNLGLILVLTLIAWGINLIYIGPNLKLRAQMIGVQQVQGKTGGEVDSKDCGYISTQPNHILNLMQRIDYLRVSLQANGGDPTLLILGPGAEDRFCVLGDRHLGVTPELSGVWESGKYLIFVGDRHNSQHSFTLNISTQQY
jgi:hypothetical protein